MKSSFLRGIGSICVLMLLLFTACKQEAAKPNLPALTPPQPGAPLLTTLVVQLPDKTPAKVWEVDAGRPLTVRELMEALREAQFAFTDTLYPGMGHLVTSVAGIRNAGGTGAYWQFCIDNVASDRGVDEMQVAPGQQVAWHYSKYGELPCKKIGE